jgi:hypothetical protein
MKVLTQRDRTPMATTRFISGDAAVQQGSVTAALHGGPSSPAGPALGVAEAVAELRAVNPATVLDDAAASTVLDRLGTSPTDARRALHFSHTGNLHGDDSQKPPSS